MQRLATSPSTCTVLTCLFMALPFPPAWNPIAAVSATHFSVSESWENVPNKSTDVPHQTSELGSPASCLQHLPAAHCWGRVQNRTSVQDTPVWSASSSWFRSNLSHNCCLCIQYSLIEFSSISRGFYPAEFWCLSCPFYLTKDKNPFWGHIVHFHAPCIWVAFCGHLEAIVGGTKRHVSVTKGNLFIHPCLEQRSWVPLCKITGKAVCEKNLSLLWLGGLTFHWCARWDWPFLSVRELPHCSYCISLHRDFLTLILLQHEDRQPVLCVSSINKHVREQGLIHQCPCSAGTPRNRLQLLCLGCIWSQLVGDPMKHFWGSLHWLLCIGFRRCSPYLWRGCWGLLYCRPDHRRTATLSPQFQQKGLTNNNSKSKGWEEGHLKNVWFALVQLVWGAGQSNYQHATRRLLCSSECVSLLRVNANLEPFFRVCRWL